LLYRELPDELNNITATDSVEDIELFAADLINAIDKEAAVPLVGAALRPIGKGILGAGKKVVGGLHNAQMNIIKDTVKSPVGLALTGGAVAVAGPKAVAEGMFPMIGTTKQAIGQVSSDLKTYNKLAYDEISDLIDKVGTSKPEASDISLDDIKDEVKRLQGINFRDDRISIEDFLTESSKNLGADKRDRILNALRAQERVYGEVGAKAPLSSEEDLVDFEKSYTNLTPEQSAKMRKQFMDTEIVYGHPVFGMTSQPRSSYNKWYRDKDPDALFENVESLNGKFKVKNANRSTIDRLLGRNKTIDANLGEIRDSYKKHITTNYSPNSAVYTGGTFLDYKKWHDEAAANKVPVQADEISDLIEKTAFGTAPFNDSDIETKDIINTVGASLVGGGLGYAAAAKGFDFLDNASLNADIGTGVQKTIGNIGKGTARVFTKNRLGTNIAANILTNTGKFADGLGGGGGKKIRQDFSTLTGKPGAAQMTKSLGKFLGVLAGAALAEEYFANWARNKVDETVVDYKVNRLEEKTAATVEVEKEPPVPKKDLKRLLHDRSIKPALTTGTFLFTLGGLSALTGRNLYGGMERVEKDEYRPANRVIIDIADPDAAEKYYERRPELIKGASTESISNLIDKVADVGGVIDMDRLNEESKKNVGAPKEDWVPETKLDKMKAKIDEKAKNAPKPIRKFDEFLANADKYKYSGRTGLGHWLLEELPFKSVESLAYAAPMIATAVLLNRNAKRGFAPLQSDPNTPYVPEGMTRVIIQESGYKDKDGNVVHDKPKDYTKYASESPLLDKTELDKIQEVIDRVTLEGDAKDEAHALRYITKNDGIVSGIKKKERMEC